MKLRRADLIKFVDEEIEARKVAYNNQYLAKLEKWEQEQETYREETEAGWTKLYHALGERLQNGQAIMYEDIPSTVRGQYGFQRSRPEAKDPVPAELLVLRKTLDLTDDELVSTATLERALGFRISYFLKAA